MFNNKSGKSIENKFDELLIWFIVYSSCSKISTFIKARES